MTERFPDFVNPAIDSSGNALAGAQMFFYTVGTSTKKNTYSDAAKTILNANPIILDSGGRYGDIFMLTDTQYKVVLAPSTDTDPPVSPIDTWDFVSPILPSGAFPFLTVVSKSANYSILTTDRGAVIRVDASSGPVTITLLAAATATSGFSIQVKKVDSSANIVTVDGDGAETIDGVTTIVLGLSNDALTLVCNGTSWDVTGEKRIPTPSVSNADQTLVMNSAGTGVTTVTNPLSASHLNGLALSNGTDATNDIDIAVGKARDTADTANLVLAAAVGKQLDVSWAAGGTPGAPTGGLSSTLTLTNDTWYHAIAGLVSGTAEVGFDTSITGANLVTDHSFTNTRRIGSVRRGTATNLLFSQIGDHFQWNDPPLDIDLTNTLTTTARLDALLVPPGIRVLVDVGTYAIDAAGAIGYVSSPDVDDEAPSATAAPLYNVGVSGVNTGDAHRFWVRTDTSSQVRSRSSAATMDTYRLTTLGWMDRRGRDA